METEYKLKFLTSADLAGVREVQRAMADLGGALPTDKLAEFERENADVFASLRNRLETASQKAKELGGDLDEGGNQGSGGLNKLNSAAEMALGGMEGLAGNAGELVELFGGEAGVAGAAGIAVTAHSVASDQTSSSTSYADVTGLTASVAANTTYVFEAYIIWQSSGSPEGIGLAVNGPASPTLLVSHAAANVTANYYQFITVATAYDTGAVATTGAGATDRAAHVRGVITTGASSGTFAIRYRAETGGANSATVKTGSTLIMTELP